jgi:hypothetical protein
MSDQVQKQKEGMFSDIYNDDDLLATFNAFNASSTAADAPPEGCCIDERGYEVMTTCGLKYLLKRKYDARYKGTLNLPQYVKLSPFVSDRSDNELVSSIINTDSWDVFKYLPESDEYEDRLGSLMVENHFYSNGSFVIKKDGARSFVRPDYLILLFNLPQNVIPVNPIIRAPPMQSVVQQEQVDPPMQQVVTQTPISVSISPPPRPAPPAAPRSATVSIAGGDRHKRAQIKAKSSKKRAQKKSSKKRINKNKNKRRTRSRKALK